MAHQESNPEDLMQEAVSLVKRIEVRTHSQGEAIVAGFNSRGWLFVYFGADPMYRFDEHGRLRRAYVDGALYRTEGDTLAKIDRHGVVTPIDKGAMSQSVLVRRDLSASELEAFRQRMRKELERTIEGIRLGRVERRHPVEAAGIAAEIGQGLTTVLAAREFLAPSIVRR